MKIVKYIIGGPFFILAWVVTVIGILLMLSGGFVGRIIEEWW